MFQSKEIDKFVIPKLNEYGQELTAYSYERYKDNKGISRKVFQLLIMIFLVL